MYFEVLSGNPSFGISNGTTARFQVDGANSFFLKKKILTLLAKSVSNYAIENNIFDIDNAIFHKSFFSTIYSHGKNGKYP